MSLSAGIIGLPNVGKSTLFNALLKRRVAETGPYPFTTVKPHTGVVKVPDRNLRQLKQMVLREKRYGSGGSVGKERPSRVEPPKTVPATVTFVDIAGLVKGAHKGEGLGNEFLGQVRGVDVLVHVVREFDDKQVAHPMGRVNPLGDVEVITTELQLKDIDTLSRVKDWKKVTGEHRQLAEKLLKRLNEGRLVREVELGDRERELLAEFQLLTAKPIMYVLNVLEADMTQLKDEVIRLAQKLKPSVTMCVKLEQDLADFEREERIAYRKELGVRGSALDRLIKKAYALLRLNTFYTIKGGKEITAWPFKTGSTALLAAETVHSEFAKNFIRAEVINVSELLATGGWREAKSQGKIMSKGRDYVLKDKDVIEFLVGG